jgi:hypothetical protein
MASRLDKARRRKFTILMRRGLSAKDAAMQAGYSESTARTHVYRWPETVEARAEVLEALDTEGVDQRFLAKHLKKLIAKGDVRAMALAGRWRGYDRAWTTRAEEPREVFSEEDKAARRREIICGIFGLEHYPGHEPDRDPPPMLPGRGEESRPSPGVEADGDDTPSPAPDGGADN